MGELTRWNIQVSKETDESLRSYLAEHGGTSGDLARFVERAVATELLRASMREVQARNGPVPDAVLEAEIDQACAEARAELLQGRKWWDD